MRIMSKILAALVFGAIAAMLATPLAAVFVDNGNSNIVFVVAFLVVFAAGLLAPTGRRAWGRGALLCGLLFLALPLSMMVLSGKVSSDMVAEASAGTEGAAVAGAVIGSGLMVGASAFIGFILGAIFVILGAVLLLGGTRDVRVVK